MSDNPKIDNDALQKARSVAIESMKNFSSAIVNERRVDAPLTIEILTAKNTGPKPE